MRNAAARGDVRREKGARDAGVGRVPEVLRALSGLPKGEFARPGRLPPFALSKHRKGKALLAPGQLECLAAEAGLPLAFAEQVVASALVLAASSGVSSGTAGGGDFATEAACRVAAILAPALRALESRPPRPGVERDPGDPFGVALAEAQWRRLAKRTAEQRALIIEHGREYQTEAFLVRLCDESEQAAADGAGDAMQLAKLAQRVAALAPGSDGQRARRTGYAWGYVANSHRATGLLPPADAALSLASGLFGESAGAECALLDPSRLIDLEARLLRDQGGTAQALKLHEQALESCHPDSRVRLLISRADTLEQCGESLRALDTLREAQSRISEGRAEPRLRRRLEWSLALTLLELDRPKEAQAQLSSLRLLAAEEGGPALLRLRWLAARIGASLGRSAEALVELALVRQEFGTIKRPADAVIVGLHETEILLREDRSAKARTLVRALRPSFESLGLQPEALGAYRRFVTAVEREAATGTMALELAKAIEPSGRGRIGPAHHRAGPEHQ